MKIPSPMPSCECLRVPLVVLVLDDMLSVSREMRNWLFKVLKVS